MDTGPLFPKLRDCNKNIIVLQGGGDAGKTVTALQYLGVEAAEHKDSVITATAQDIPNLKGGALRSFQKYVSPDIKPFLSEFNKTERTYLYKNQSLFEFKSFEDEEDAKGSERDYLFVNEANKISWGVFWQLQRKTRKKVIIDYNPSGTFWAHTELLSGTNKEFAGKVQLYIVDHRHNPFLSKEDHEAYENISDPELFRVYARGLTGKIKGLIFGHFKKTADWPEKPDRIIWGCDWGYTNDPTAIVKVAVVGRQRYHKEVCYEPGLSAERVKEIMILNGWEEGQMIYCETDPNMINQLRILRMPAYPAIKGPGSEVASIAKVKEYECFYSEDSINFDKEILNWKWVEAEDIQTGKKVMTNQPMKGGDHCFVGDTMIETNEGLKRIENTNPGDYVQTSNGFRRVLLNWNNGKRLTKEFCLHFDTFCITLRCTENHLIKTESGWVEISKLQSGLTVYLSKHLMEMCLSYTQANDISQEVEGECMLLSTNFITGNVQTVTMCTTLTKTHGIIDPRIFVSGNKNITDRTISKKELRTIPSGLLNFKRKVLRLLQSEKYLKKKELGLKKIGKPVLGPIKRCSKTGVINVVKNILSRRLVKLEGFAPISVRQNTGETKGLITLKESAKNAGQPLSSIDTQKQSVVQKAVLLKIDGRNERSEVVYDLTVDETHEYLANGILVHNCCDASRYAIYTDSFRHR
jgi:phage terminase large subunit